MEHIIFSHIMLHLEEFKILSDIQHGFCKYHSCETQLLITLNAFSSSYAITAYKVQSTNGFKLGFALGNNLS